MQHRSGRNDKELDFQGKSLMGCVRLEQALQSGDLPAYTKTLRSLLAQVLYAKESTLLTEAVEALCNQIEDRLLRTQALLGPDAADAFENTLRLFNVVLRYERSVELFGWRNWNDPNNHSSYRRTFAEARLGLGEQVSSADCGVQYPRGTEVFGATGEQAYREVVQPIIDVLAARNLQYDSGVNRLFVLSMNGDYFDKFGVAQALSIMENDPGRAAGMLFLVYEPTALSIELIAKLQARGHPAHAVLLGLPTFPDVLDRNTYLASVRFCVVQWLLETFGRTVVVTDADQVFVGDLTAIVSDSASDADMAIIDYSLAYPYISLYSKLGASYVEFYPTRRALKYARALARFLAINLKARSCWTLDQLALLACQNLCTDLRVHHIDNGMILDRMSLLDNSVGARSQALIWNGAGPMKFQANPFTDKVQRLMSSV